ncbi:putative DNA primase/polymerase protein [Achromobacter phage AXY1]|nr:putative DNA primase/polymerase protein [Achromobacter phage AXY1]
MTKPVKIVDCDYMQNYGLGLVKNGYQIIPIAPGKKSPPFDDWQRVRSTTSTVTGWVNGDYGRMGIGINTTNTPAIDIDIEDDRLADEVEEWIRENIADAPVRYGNGCKRLMLFRTDEPFTKLMTPKYIGEMNMECKIEVLGQGQQFVAYHIHPDTNLPYRWTTDEQPVNTLAGDLPLLTREKAQELIDWFNAYAQRDGYKLTGRAALRARPTGKIDRDNPFIEDASTVDMTTDELRERLMMVQDNNDYENWFSVGMALYHQYDGNDEGMRLWEEWSESSPKFDRDYLVKKWKSFNVEGKGRAPLTAAFILKQANEAEKEAEAAELNSLIADYMSATTLEQIEAVSERARHAEISKTKRILLVTHLQRAWKRVNDGTLGKVEARKQIAFQPNNRDMPEWLREWVYDTSVDKFFNTRTKAHVSLQGFDVMNNRKAFSKEDRLEELSMPSMKASDQAINKYSIPVVSGVRYEPDRDELFEEFGDTYANSYSELSTPDMPEWEHMLPRDKRNIERVKGHCFHLLPDEREAHALIDYLAYTVQNPGAKISYAVLLQGVEGDGKSFFSRLMSAVLGSRNTRIINAAVLESQFNGWVEGQCIVCVEEVRMLTHNRHEIMNRVKDIVANEVINVHPKGRDPYEARNTSNYLLFTNFQDAIPINIDDRRYLVLFSQWQSRLALTAFKEDHPTYYADLHQALVDSPGALRRWLMDWEISPEFNAKDHAPLTKARAMMIAQTQSEMLLAINEVLVANEGRPGLTPKLIVLSDLLDELEKMGVPAPEFKTLAAELKKANFKPIGQVAVDGKRVSLWSENANTWIDFSGKPRVNEIRKFLGPVRRATDLDDDDDQL